MEKRPRLSVAHVVESLLQPSQRLFGAAHLEDIEMSVDPKVLDEMSEIVQIYGVQQRKPSLQNVCAETFETECQPDLVALLNTSSRPCACMGDGPFLISPALTRIRAGLSPAEPLAGPSGRVAEGARAIGGVGPNADYQPAPPTQKENARALIGPSGFPFALISRSRAVAGDSIKPAPAASDFPCHMKTSPLLSGEPLFSFALFFLLVISSGQPSTSTNTTNPLCR